MNRSTFPLAFRPDGPTFRPDGSAFEKNCPTSHGNVRHFRRSVHHWRFFVQHEKNLSAMREKIFIIPEKTSIIARRMSVIPSGVRYPLRCVKGADDSGRSDPRPPFAGRGDSDGERKRAFSVAFRTGSVEKMAFPFPPLKKGPDAAPEAEHGGFALGPWTKNLLAFFGPCFYTFHVYFLGWEKSKGIE